MHAPLNACGMCAIVTKFGNSNLGNLRTILPRKENRERIRNAFVNLRSSNTRCKAFKTRKRFFNEEGNTFPTFLSNAVERILEPVVADINSAVAKVSFLD